MKGYRMPEFSPGSATHPPFRLPTDLLRAIGAPGFDETLLDFLEAEFGIAEIDVYRTPVNGGAAGPARLLHASRLDASGQRESKPAPWESNGIWSLFGKCRPGEMIFRPSPTTETATTFTIGLREEQLTTIVLRAAPQKPLEQTVLAQLNASAVTIMSALLAHWKQGAPQVTATQTRILPVERIEKLLTTIWPDLPTRERQVCARTVTGMTALGIALDLDIGVSTVSTYRRRAYARMGICSAYELFAPLISSCDPMLSGSAFAELEADAA